jgi:hypothetical protein
MIGAPGYQPPWVDALRRNVDVLGEDPGAVYGAEIFRGRADRFEEVRTQLPVTEGPWFLWRVIVGQIEAATALPDAEFKAAIPVSIDLLERHPAAKTFGLSRLLTRYRRCAAPLLHERLRDFAVEAWGNPWLTNNEASWASVGDDARLMVAEWLKLALMQKFFGLLADDGLNDRRRLEFWETYHRSVHAMYFALGETARTHRGPDFREVRRQMEGLQLTLTHSTAKNNAFIMCIGRHVVVEFGVKGNACFIFERDKLPFALEGEVAGNHLALKHASNLERMLHTDTRDEPWEDKFRRVLAEVVGVEVPPDARAVPQAPAPARAFGAMPRATDRATRSAADPPPALRDPPPSRVFDDREFAVFCRAKKLEWRDSRGGAGFLRVFTKREDEAVSDQLEAWGFSFNGKCWWRT